MLCNVALDDFVMGTIGVVDVAMGHVVLCNVAVDECAMGTIRVCKNETE